MLKVPPEKMDAMLDQLGRLGHEQSRSSSTQDVTQDVADVDARVASMQASIARVRAILSRADRIGDVVSVEGELSRRTTELESLQARQRALAGQVNYATITLQLKADRAAAPAAPADRGGFAGGLRDGWHAFTAALGWVLTAVGAVLPFLLLASRSRSPGRRCAAAGSPRHECTSSHDPGEHVRVGLRQHAVAEVEDVPRRGADPRRATRRTSASTTGQSARSSSAGSRLPCTARPGPTRRAASSSGTRQSTPTTSAPASPISAEQLAGADTEVDPRHARVGRAPASTAARVRQHVARGSRRADSAPAQESNSCTAPTPASTCTRRNVAGDRGQPGAAARATASGAPYISALVRAWSADGPPSTR